MTIYLDTSVIIPYLHEPIDQTSKTEEAKRLFAAIRDGKVQAMVTFYSFPELYGYVVENYTSEQVNETFRVSLVELFSAPLIVKPFLDRADLEKLRRRFTISDSYDVFHVAAALFYSCSSIITFDHHFHQVADVIPAYTPAEFFATFESSDAK